MCGIFASLVSGRVDAKNLINTLLNGLKRLEYRGYDSSGIALLTAEKIFICKEAGKLVALEDKLQQFFAKKNFATAGIAHTRWATHGAPNSTNAHPHVSYDGNIAIVHNGIIENYNTIKKQLVEANIPITSDTDSELFAHLIAKYYAANKNQAQSNGSPNTQLPNAVRRALKDVVGTYGIAAICRENPKQIVGVRKSSPLIIGVKDNVKSGEKEFFLSSDIAAIIQHTRDVIYLEEDEMVTINENDFTISSLLSGTYDAIDKKTERITLKQESIEKGNYPHFMLKEIHEQVETSKSVYSGRIFTADGKVKLDGLNLTHEDAKNIKRILIMACGTSWHAALVGEYLIENLANLPVEVNYASEFTQRNCPIEEDTLVLFISQSGETADTLIALREIKDKGLKVYGIVNVVGSSIARETDGGIYLHAGPEIGVASTKAFTSQVLALILFAMYLGRHRHLSRNDGIEILTALEKIPSQIKTCLQTEAQVKNIVQKYLMGNHALYLGRSYNFPVALEGALKLKEISYIHAEGYPAAEMKHGPIALIEDGMPVIVIATDSTYYKKMIINIKEIKAREGKMIAIVSEGDDELSEICDEIIIVPKTLELLSPVLNAIPMQLLAYHAAITRDCDVDQPRNLAKSVTVE